MKKIKLVLSIITVCFLFSCKKDRQCECTATTLSPSGNTSTGSTKTETYTKMKLSEAKSICQRSTVVTANAQGSVTTVTNDCKLK